MQSFECNFSISVHVKVSLFQHLMATMMIIYNRYLALQMKYIIYEPKIDICCLCSILALSWEWKSYRRFAVIKTTGFFMASQTQRAQKTKSSRPKGPAPKSRGPEAGGPPNFNIMILYIQRKPSIAFCSALHFLSTFLLQYRSFNFK